MRSPETREEIRSFLGLVGYMGRFVPDLATKTYRLRCLMTQNEKFQWLPDHEEDYRTLKEYVAKAPTLSYFAAERRTRLIVDASPVGLGAVLVQFEDEHSDKPCIISYAAKSLTQTERKYSQTEKEAMAAVWGVEKFREFLLGRHFELETDHQALVAIFNPKKTPPGRIERWVMRLQLFSFTVIHKAGKQNIADPISRMAKTLGKPKSFDENDDTIYLNAIKESMAMDVSEVAEAIETDPELMSVKEALQNDLWNDPETRENVKAYLPFKDSLSLFGEYVIRDCQLVIPKSLRQRLLELGHEGHPGESAMSQRLRAKVWWPGMDKEARQHVKNCEGCQMVQRSAAPEPMKRKVLPNEPWLDVALDFLSVTTNKYLLVVVDYFSRYMEVRIMERITATKTINELEWIFLNNGYPCSMTLDNGKQLISKEMEEYCATKNIKLNHSTPYWPQENGEVERQNSTLMKRLRISHALGRSMEDDLIQFLSMYNTTPHSVTGKAPLELMHKRNIRTKIPEIKEIERHLLRPASALHDQDTISKFKGKEREDMRRGAKESNLEIGDSVRMKTLTPHNKLETPFSADKYTVVNKSGARTTIRKDSSNKLYERNSRHLLKIPQESLPEDMPDQPANASLFTNPQFTLSPGTTSTPKPVAPPTSMMPAIPRVEPSEGRPSRNTAKPAWMKDFIGTNDSSLF